MFGKRSGPITKELRVSGAPARFCTEVSDSPLRTDDKHGLIPDPHRPIIHITLSRQRLELSAQLPSLFPLTVRHEASDLFDETDGFCIFTRRAFAAPAASMLELTDIILRIQYEAIDATTLTTFLE